MNEEEQDINESSSLHLNFNCQEAIEFAALSLNAWMWMINVTATYNSNTHIRSPTDHSRWHVVGWDQRISVLRPQELFFHCDIHENSYNTLKMTHHHENMRTNVLENLLTANLEFTCFFHKDWQFPSDKMLLGPQFTIVCACNSILSWRTGT